MTTGESNLLYVFGGREWESGLSALWDWGKGVVAYGVEELGREHKAGISYETDADVGNGNLETG